MTPYFHVRSTQYKAVPHPYEPEKLQLSNFSVIEKRETLDIELIMTRFGEVHGHFWQGTVHKYVFALGQ